MKQELFNRSRHTFTSMDSANGILAMVGEIKTKNNFELPTTEHIIILITNLKTKRYERLGFYFSRAREILLYNLDCSRLCV